MATVRSLAEEAGLTVLLATHSREVAARADRVIHMRDGLLRNPPTSSLRPDPIASEDNPP